MTKKKDKLEELEQRAGEYLAGWQRAQADYQNLEKEVAKSKKNIVKFANADLLSEVLPIYDNLKLALEHIPQDERRQEWVIGIQHIKNQFQQFLQKSGIEEINTKDKQFDPEIHEAVESKGKGNTIIKEIKTGYKLHDKVLYPAKVIIN